MGPSPSPDSEVARLLAAHRAGDRAALDRVFPFVYAELRRVAHRQLSHRRPGETLNTTALVHECYLKLAGSAQEGYEDRRHFLAVAARAMRQILVDYARMGVAQKRGGGVHPVSLDPAELPQPDRAAELVALDEALTRLATLDDRLARIVELRFFGGLSVEETADVLEISPRTVKRDWRKARSFLFETVREGNG
jgi:RNA polymerase sigma factor (TIGR02999 family)